VEQNSSSPYIPITAYLTRLVPLQNSKNRSSWRKICVSDATFSCRYQKPRCISSLAIKSPQQQNITTRNLCPYTDSFENQRIYKKRRSPI